MFEDTTTVAQANELLQTFGLGLKGGLPGAGLLLVDLPASDLDRAMAVVGALNTDSRVKRAIVDSAGTPEALPPHNVTANVWSWEVPISAVGPATTANWGLELVRAPQLWHLDAFARRDRAAVSVAAGVVDDGFTDLRLVPGASSHPDLGKLQIPRDTKLGDHGTAVAGVIGATFDNHRGVEGINPWLERFHAVEMVFTNSRLQTWGSQLAAIRELLVTDLSVKVVNNSYGLSDMYAPLHIQPSAWDYGDLNGDNDNTDEDVANNPDFDEVSAPDNDGDGHDDTWADVVAWYGDIYHDAVQNLIKSSPGTGGFYIVASAGNAGPSYDAVDNSPIANAAVRHGGRFLAVEAIDRAAQAWPDSTLNAAVSAPGVCIRSTEHNDGTNFDTVACAEADAGQPNTDDELHATKSGASFAAPHVTGLIAALWKLEPDLTVEQIRSLVTGDGYTATTIGGTRPRVDAFAAAMGIDVVRGYKTLQTALVDVDDESPDGNLRTDPFNGVTVLDNFTRDRRRGDGAVNMSDFRAWRDAYLQTYATAFGGGVSLDGAAAHFKKDLNFDGCVAADVAAPPHPVEEVPFRPGLQCLNAPAENVFPRYDFNGDGIVGRFTDRAPFKIDPDVDCAHNQVPGCLRDLDVMLDPDVWSAEDVPPGDVLANRDAATPAPPELKDLPDYVHSFDVQVRIDWAKVDPGYEEVLIEVESELPAADGDARTPTASPQAARLCGRAVRTRRPS